MSDAQEIYGIMAEFDGPNELVHAAEEAYRAGYRKMDGYSPYPIEELAEAIGVHHTILPALVLIAGVCGLIGGFGLASWASAVAYPINVGGRPLISVPSFIPVTFETTVLLAALTAVFGMIALNGLPQPYHPVFNVPQFAHASRDSFFLCIEAADPLFDPQETRKFLERLHPRSLAEVEP